ncbi:MAG: M61 family metallopeptidase [Candidatus Sericytochromatia bacterium]|nr:M61 family metallopeptidase [Candidatus Tanganyikabacteria bacterium]
MQPIAYRLRIDRPHTHRLSVELRVPPQPGPLEMAIPAWTPGAYKVVDHARNVRRVAAHDPAGQPLRVERRDLHTWAVHGTERGVTVTYEVFADKLMIHQAQLNADHAFLNGGPVWLCVKACRHWPATVQVDVPPGWRVATALPPAQGGTWTARDYDELVDSPIEAGPFGLTTVGAAGVEWEVVWHDTLGSQPEGSPDLLAKVADGVARLGKAAADLMGPPPFSRYVCFFHESTEPGYLNGLEHQGSLVMQGPLEAGTRPEPFFTMVAHEIMHAWNGRRLAPQGLGRGCDLWRPAHTTALWLVEGGTEYYAEVLALRAGVVDVTTFLGGLADMISQYERTPGRLVTSLEEASFITWQFGDDRWNGAINYYLKGALVTWALDAELRDRTGGKRSMDDVLRALWERFGDHTEYLPEAIEDVAAEIAGGSLDEFFDRMLRSVEPIDWSVPAGKLGLDLRARDLAALGLRATGPAGGLKVEHVDAFGPAEEAGIQTGDILVTVGGKKATERALALAKASGRPGDALALQALRGERLLGFDLVLGGDRTYDLVPAERPSEKQQAILAAFLGTAAARPLAVAGGGDRG